MTVTTDFNSGTTAEMTAQEWPFPICWQLLPNYTSAFSNTLDLERYITGKLILKITS